VQSALLAAQWLARHHASGRDKTPTRHIVLVGALDRTQSLPLPPHFAATQGALAALAMALGHELGSAGIFVNLVALGLLDGGLSRELVSRRRKDYETFSALRRLGTTKEAAKVIVWLALENTFIQGKVVSANGGI
jgi:3-oxoacyl-[acyl-carrier protein] reductase